MPKAVNSAGPVAEKVAGDLFTAQVAQVLARQTYGKVPTFGQPSSQIMVEIWRKDLPVVPW